jgi:hypothetical protein
MRPTAIAEDDRCAECERRGGVYRMTCVGCCLRLIDAHAEPRVAWEHIKRYGEPEHVQAVRDALRARKAEREAMPLERI